MLPVETPGLVIVRAYLQFDMLTARHRSTFVQPAQQFRSQPVDKAVQMDRLTGQLSEAHEGLNIHVREADVGSLPRFELKAKRLKDDRIVIGGTGEKRES